MKIALIASPFIEVPPKRYGGTELFVAHLAAGLKRRGVDVTVYANGDSTLDCPLRFLYPHSEWPISGEPLMLKDLSHASWAIRDCWDKADIIHLNSTAGLGFSRFDGPRFAYTIHHPHEARTSEFYSHFPQVEFVAISDAQRAHENLPHMRTVHHGVEMCAYRLQRRKQNYFCFLGRIAPVKGTHVAIELAKRTGIPLKIAGEVQPSYRDYFESQVKPHLDGRLIEYVGEADLETKNELLGNAAAMVFPIQWNEPFGLVMLEAMATGTPVLAMPGGSVSEVVAEGVSGFVCRSLDELEAKAHEVFRLDPVQVRRYVEKHFSVERMVDDYLSLYEEMLSGARRPAARAGTAVESVFAGSAVRSLPPPPASDPDAALDEFPLSTDGPRRVA